MLLKVSKMSKATKVTKGSVDLTRDQMKTLVKNLTEGKTLVNPDSPSPCWKSHLKPNKQSGYVQVTVGLGQRNKRTKPYAHRVMASHAKKKYTYCPHIFNTNDSSHLCGNKWCINPDHQVLETGLYNQTRDCCHMFLHKKEGYICPHEPCCISHNSSNE